MMDLAQPDDRDDGKPWVLWTQGNEYLASLPGHRERVELAAWFDRERQSLILTLTQYDESMSTYVPCWAQLALVDVGPFFAKDEVLAFTDQFADTIIGCYGIHSPSE